jgi:ubiquinone biosynthesis UbiH/UbiF/VisC/COQ6 family hydroxylase
VTSHDVIVVGGGLVGAATALGLSRIGSRVLLVDRTSGAGNATAVHGSFGMDIRNIACSPGSRALLEHLGVWSRLEAAPYRKMLVWEDQGVTELEFDASEVDRAELGWILENGPTVGALWEMLEAHPNTEVLLGEVSDIQEHADHVAVSVGESVVTARLLVGVDGARSTVRDLLRIAVDTRPTGHQALATLVKTERGHEGVAYQRFLLDGPLALLPSADSHISSVVWSQPPDQARERLETTDGTFCRDIGSAIEHRLGEVVAVDRRLAFPLQQHVVANFNPMERVLLIGDAARVLHPLAGLGANVGFEDVRDLLVRVEGLPEGADLGGPGLWRAYARKRRVRAQLMVRAMAAFKNVYAEGDPLLQWLRNSAVGWVNGARPVKRQIIREALGLGPLASTW